MTAAASTDTTSIRSSEMLLMHEELARARVDAVRAEAGSQARARRLIAARRWSRRAEQAALRARLAHASVR